MSDPIEAEGKFHILRRGRKLGPFSQAQIGQMIARQLLGSKDQIAPAGSVDWQRIDQWRRELRSDQPESQTSKEQTAATGADQEVPNLSASAPPAIASDGWYVAIDGRTEGPFDMDTLGQRIGQQSVHAETPVWRSGMQDWKPAKEVLSAVFSSPVSSSTHDVRIETLPTQDFASRDLLQRRAFWVLGTCVMTYLFALEALAASAFQVYVGVAARRIENSGLIVFSAVAFFVMACLLLMTAIEMTKLRSAMSRAGGTGDSKSHAVHEHRVWLFAGLSAAFVILCQIVIAFYVLIQIAGAT